MGNTRAVRLDTLDDSGRMVASELVSDDGYLTLKAADGQRLSGSTIDLDAVLQQMRAAGVDRQKCRRVGRFGVVVAFGRRMPWEVYLDRQTFAIGGGRLGVTIKHLPERPRPGEA